MRRLCASLLLLGMLLACGSPTEPTGNLSFSTLAASSVPGTAGPQIQTVVRDSVAWSQIWSELWGDQAPAPPLVDFSRDMAVLVTGSEFCFGGAEVEAIVLTGGALRIQYGDAAPTLCLCAQASLSFHAVRAPRVLGEPIFQARSTPPLCPT